jgi:hypothetical protein
MTPRRFRWLLTSRGPAMDVWPGRERQAALALLRRDQEVCALLAEVLAAEEDPPEPDAQALGRLCGSVRRALAPPGRLERGVRWGLVVLCITAGCYLGLPGADPEASGTGITLLQSSLPETVLAALDP